MAYNEKVLKQIEGLKIISDAPLFELDYLKEEDAFDHEAYAETILEIIKKNEPPLTIGLFGRWGIGKSTVINIVRQRIEKACAKAKSIYFNAWQHSGDSFRREFLLTCVSELFKHDQKKREDALNRIKTLFHKAIPKETLEDAKFFTQLKNILTGSIKLNPTYTCQLVITLVIVVILGALGLWKNDNTLKVSALLTLLLSLILTKQIPNVFEITKPEIIDPQLVLPEQFYHEFMDIMEYWKLDKILIIIDDFDRCEPDKVYDILTAMKTFLKHPKCFFLVAMDDKQIIKTLSESVTGYNEETLRKFFDTAIRMAPIAKSDLISFANEVAKKTGIPDDVIQVATLAGYDEPRKIKHFLNTYIVKYNFMKLREKKGLLPIKVDDNLREIAKLVVMEMEWPAIYDAVINEPAFLNELENKIWEKRK